MSIQGEINRIKSNLAGAYSAVAEKGGVLPGVQNSENLKDAIRGIPTDTGGTPSTPDGRPADWLSMPEPQNDEMYLLFHIPDGVSSLLAFTVICTGSYNVALGTVTDGQFVQQSAVSVATGAKYEGELFADDFGDLTSDGFKQVMVKVSGADILMWEPSTHSKKTSPKNFASWNIVEIACRLPSGTKVACGNVTAVKALRLLRYFSWYGVNNITNASHMFSYCYSLVWIQPLDTSKATNMSCMFYFCHSLTSIPPLDTHKVKGIDEIFSHCYSLTSIPPLDTSKATNMSGILNTCYSLTLIPPLDTSEVINMGNPFANSHAIAKITLNPDAANWAGCAISLKDCSLMHDALVELFNSLPAITSANALTLTGNPGVSELTSAEKAIATGKKWTLTV